VRSRRVEKFQGEEQLDDPDFTGDVPRGVEQPCGMEHFFEARIHLLRRRQTQASS